MIKIYLIVAVVAIVTLVGNILINRYIIRKAITCYIVPFFENKGFRYLSVEKVGLFSKGDFTDDVLETVPFMIGMPTMIYYRYVYYTDKDNLEKRTTIKINALFMMIRKVEIKGFEE